MATFVQFGYNEKTFWLKKLLILLIKIQTLSLSISQSLLKKKVMETSADKNF